MSPQGLPVIEDHGNIKGKCSETVGPIVYLGLRPDKAPQQHPTIRVQGHRQSEGGLQA